MAKDEWSIKKGMAWGKAKTEGSRSQNQKPQLKIQDIQENVRLF